MILKVFDNLFLIIGVVIYLIISLICLWVFLTGVLLKSETYKLSSWFGKGVSSEAIYGRFLILVIPILGFFLFFSDFTSYLLESLPQNFDELKSGIIYDGKGFLTILFIIIAYLLIVTIGLGGIYFFYLLVFKLIKIIARIPLNKIKKHYRKLLINISNKDYINTYTGFLSLDSIKKSCNEFQSINNLPFDFKKEFFLLPSYFDNKREGKYSFYERDKFKNLFEFIIYSNKWNEIKLVRENYLNFFSMNFFSKKLLRYKWLVNNLYIPFSLIFPIIVYYLQGQILLISTIYAFFHFLFLKKCLLLERPTFEYKSIKWLAYFAISSMVLMIPFFVYFIIKEYDKFYRDNGMLSIDITFAVIIFLFILFSDLYDYFTEIYMISIFSRILKNEKLFCFFYTINCFEINKKGSIEVEGKPGWTTEHWYRIKFDPKIDF